LIIVSISSSVLVGSLGRTVWLKVSGRGTFQNSPNVKEFVKQMIERGHRDFVIDLDGCELMDSTFMGTLAGIALRLREVGEGGLKAVNVNPRNASLLENLGLDQLFDVEAGQGAPAPASLRQAEAVPEENARETVLKAHEALIEADAENAIKFQDVVDYLRQELAQGDGSDH
jgi:anti-anti-sigma factor